MSRRLLDRLRPSSRRATHFRRSPLALGDSRILRTTLYVLLLLAALLNSGCRDTRTNKTYQPVTLRAAVPSASVSGDTFTPTDIIGIRPTVSSNPVAFEIWLQLSPSAFERWLQLPAGTEFVCSTSGSVIGRTTVEREMGIGKGAYCFRLVYPDRQAFDEAVKRLQ